MNGRPCFMKPKRSRVSKKLDSLDVYSLGTLGALLGFEGDLLVLFEGAEAGGVDRRVVCENVL